MKKTLCILFAFLFTPFAIYADVEGVATATVEGVATATVEGVEDSSCSESCGDYFICQNFEGTGYDNSESWSEDAGSINPDDTTATVLRGSQQCEVDYSSGTARVTSPTFTAQSTLYGHFLLKLSGTPAAIQTIFFIRGSGSNIAAIRVNTSRQISIEMGTTSAATTTGLTVGTKYHIWWKAVKGTGSDSTGWVEVTSASTYSPTGTGDDYKTVSGGDITVDMNAIQFSEDKTYNIYVDQVYVDNVAISNICP